MLPPPESARQAESVDPRERDARRDGPVHRLWLCEHWVGHGEVACLPRSACLCVARRQGAGHRQVVKERLRREPSCCPTGLRQCRAEARRGRWMWAPLPAGTVPWTIQALLRDRSLAWSASCRGPLRSVRPHAATISRVDGLARHRGFGVLRGLLRPKTRRNRVVSVALQARGKGGRGYAVDTTVHEFVRSIRFRQR